MHWHEVTAIYVIGNRYPVATFVHEAQAEKWGETEFPGEWIKKRVKIPPLPLTSKASRKNLKNLAAVLDQMEWEAEADDEDDSALRLDPGS
ncbi:MAG: hypothetical protein ACOCZK_04845 [Planctomycetota bacterium]